MLEGPIDAARLVWMNDAGIDWFSHFNSYYPRVMAARVASVTESLRINRAGFVMKDLVTYASADSVNGDNAAGRLVYNSDQPLDYAAIDNSINPPTGLNNASTLGWIIWDEPCDTLGFGQTGRMSRYLDSHANGVNRLPYTNLFPSYAYDVSAGNPSSCYYQRFGAGSGMSKEAGYAAYLRAYLSALRPDHRP